MELTNNQTKMDLVARLVKEGAIDFNEAVMLLEVEKEFPPYMPYVPYPYVRPWDWWAPQPTWVASTGPHTTLDHLPGNYQTN